MTMPTPPEKFELPDIDVAAAAERLFAAIAGEVWAKATFEQTRCSRR